MAHSNRNVTILWFIYCNRRLRYTFFCMCTLHCATFNISWNIAELGNIFNTVIILSVGFERVLEPLVKKADGGGDMCDVLQPS